MDISIYNVEKACSVPKRITIVNGFTGETLFDEEGKTFDIFAYGMKSSIANNILNAMQRKHGKKNNRTTEQDRREGAEFLGKLTQGYSENIEGVDGPYKSAFDMYMAEDWIAKQVLTFTNDESNYDPNA